MKCISCDGSGDWGDHEPEDQEDPGTIPCDQCGGTGRVSFIVRLRWWVEMRFIVAIGAVDSSPVGRWWWRMTRERNARRLARSLPSRFAAIAKHGERLNVLSRMTAMSEELGGPAMNQITDRQRRMCWEAKRAVEVFEE